MGYHDLYSYINHLKGPELTLLKQVEVEIVIDLAYIVSIY